MLVHLGLIIDQGFFLLQANLFSCTERGILEAGRIPNQELQLHDQKSKIKAERQVDHVNFSMDIK